MQHTDWKSKDLGIIGNGIRYRVIKRMLSPYRKYRKFLKESQWWSEDRLIEYQLDRLRVVLESAYRHVPYYRGLMQIYDIRPNDIKSIDYIVRLPVLEKEKVRRHHREFISDHYFYPSLYKCHTSGTTGKPLTLYRNLENIGFDHALLMRQWEWAGLGPNERYASLKGTMIPRYRTDHHVFWSFSPAENILYMSSYHLTEENTERYVTAMQKYRIKAVEGYPSSLYTLSRFMLAKNIRLELKAVLTTSETLVPEQKNVIEKAFGTQIYDYYGMAERVAAIHTCEHGRYHLVPEYSLTEFVKTDLTETEGYYEVVGTSFTNLAMPLIRYRVGDVVIPGTEHCPCGRSYPVVDRIVGRTDDYIVTPSGKLVGRLDHIFKGAENLIEAQIYQPDTQNVILRIVPDKSFDRSDGERIIRKLRQRLGETMHFEIEQVDSIPRGVTGKLKSVVSEVPVN